ncbi:hypothetical protein N9059_01650 [bacterium]|nr:hypothetical protein [bacterium]
MRSNSKIAGLFLMFFAVMIFTGCGGFSASPSVSPATFLLPGLGFGKVHPDENQEDAALEVVVSVDAPAESGEAPSSLE